MLAGGATFSNPGGGVLTIFNGVNLNLGDRTMFNQVNGSGSVTVASGQTLTWNDEGTLRVNGGANTSG